MKRILWSLAFCSLCTLAISAATLVPGPGGAGTNPDPNFTFTIDTVGGTLNLATPGGSDVLTVSGVGDVAITDGGTPGQFILSLNGGLTEAVLLTFNTAGVNIINNGTLALIPATGAMATPTVTDPALLALIGSSTFGFLSRGSQESPFVFDFTQAALPESGVPEPAVAFTVGAGLLGLAVLRLKKRGA